jgi:hypothetical protein
MIIFVASWLVLAFIFAILAHIAIWARTGANKPRGLSVLGFFVGAALTLGTLFVGSGASMPCVAGINAPLDKFTVLGFNAVPDVKIEIFFNAPIFGSRVCSIPWSDKTANDLVDAQQKKMQLGMQLEGGAKGVFHPGSPQTFPLNIDDGMTQKPHSDIQAP